MSGFLKRRQTFRSWSSIIALTKTGLSGAYLLTLLTEIGVLLSTILTLRLAASFFGVTGFGEYAIAKRAFSLLTFPLLLGLGISIPRYVALNSDGHQAAERQIFLISGMSISVLILGVFSLFPILLPDQFTWLFYGDSRYKNLAVPILTTVVGLHLQTLLYGYLRGELQMSLANLLRFISAVIVPPLALLFSGRSVYSGILFTGLGWIGVSLIFGVYMLSKVNFKSIALESAWEKAKELISYGLPRVPGEFALFGFFALPTIVISHLEGVVPAGYFSFGVSLLQLIGAVFATVGILLLPYVSGLMGQRRIDKIRQIVANVHVLSVVLALGSVLLLQLGLVFVVPLLMGSEFMPAVDQTRWLIWATIPYVSYVVLRNPLDAVARWPYNSINLILGLVVLLVLLFAAYNIVSAQFSTFLALTLVSGLSIVAWRRAIGRVDLDIDKSASEVDSLSVGGEVRA